MELATSNTSLWKANTELVEENKGLFAKVVEYKSKIKELVEKNKSLWGKMPSSLERWIIVVDELVKEKAENVTLKADLESTLKKM